MQPTQAVNPFQQVLDDEAYQLLTKCDPKLGVAVLSLALKKFSENKEFLYFLKPEYRDDFIENINQIETEELNSAEGQGKTNDISMNQSSSNTTSAQENSSPSAIAVAW